MSKKNAHTQNSSSSDSTYLQNVTLKEGDVSKTMTQYLTNIRVVILVVLVLVAGGLTSFFTLPRTLNPNISIPIIFVSTALPGANPEDIESLVTIPLEDAVRGVSGIDTATSVSSQNSSSITLQFLSSVNADKAKQDVQSAVDTVTDLPGDATTPVVAKLDFEDQPIWSFALTSTADDASLLRYANTLRDRIESLTKIDRVVLRGFEEQEVQVTIDQDQINTLGINPTVLARSIQTAVNAQPAGTVITDESTFSLSIDPSATTLEELRNVIISANNATYRLGEIAVIAERPKPGTFGAYYTSGDNADIQRSVTFDIYKSLSERIDESYSDAQQLVETELAEQNDQFRIATITSTADDMNEQFSSLFRNFAVTIGLVFIVLLLFFGLRQAIVASFTIPLTFMGALLVMNTLGITLNFLSSFSLLLSLGLLVDVTIVILSAITSYYRTGRFSPREAGLLTWRDYSITLLVTTLTTVWAFFPLLLATGIIGEFIKPIPIVVSATLLSSLIVGLLIVLPFMIALLKPSVPRRVRIFLLILFILAFGILIWSLLSSLPFAPALFLLTFSLLGIVWISRKKIAQYFHKLLSGNGKFHFFKQCILSLVSDGLLHIDGLSHHYKRIISKIITTPELRKKTVIIVTLFFFFASGLVGFGLVRSEFFPKENQDFFYVQLELAKGTLIKETQKQALELAQKLSSKESIKEIHIQLATGISGDGALTSQGTYQALLTVRLFPKKDRSIASTTLAQSIRDEFANYPNGDISVFELSGGPPAGADIQITLLGEKSDTLNSLANQIITYLNDVPGTTNVKLSITGGTPKIAVIPNMEILAQNNYSVDDAGLLLRTFANGFELASDVSFDDLADKRNVILRLDSELPAIENIGTLVAPQNPSGASLYSFGKLELQNNPSEITREDGKRSLTVTASVTEGFSIPDIGKNLETFAGNMTFPNGYSWKTGGVNDENAKSVQSILQAMVLAFLLILGTLVIRLGSYRKALIVLLVIPLALIGVFTIFALTGTPLSFPALIGVLALFGIVVNNSIIVVDKINQNLEQNMSQEEAIVDASASRLEPILLSSLTTIIGLIPITLSDPLWQGLGGAIIAGLLFSGTIMLFFIPVVYTMWFKEE